MLRPLIVDVTDLWQNANKSLLSASAAVGETTLTVYNIANFAVDQILQIAEYGEEGTEIVQTHASTAPTGNTVTLAAALTKAHPKDVAVYVIPYDQIEISHAATETGVKTVLSTQNINPTNPEIRYDDSTYSSGYYFTRYKNTISGNFSGYSDPIPYDGYDLNTVGYLVYGVLEELGKELGDDLTYTFLISKINSGLNYIRGSLKRWSNYQEFDYNVGQLNRGETKIALPLTYYDRNSNKSCLSVRIGSNKFLIYKDKREFTNEFAYVDKTQIATQAEIGDVTLELDNSADFPESGSVDVFVNNVKYSISFTANDTSTGILSGIPASGDGSITTTLAVDTNVWYNATEEQPTYFSIWGGYLHIGGLVSEQYAGENIFMDFYTDIAVVDSDTDIITQVRYDMLYYWLRWHIRMKTENKGRLDFKDGDFLMFSNVLDQAKRREASGQKFKMKPKVSGINYRTQNNLDFERT